MAALGAEVLSQKKVWKKGPTNPRYSLRSTIDERINFIPKHANTNKPVNLLRWWHSLTPEQRKRILKITKTRKKLLTLLKNPTLGLKEISDIMSKEGHVLTKQNVSQISQRLSPDRKSAYSFQKQENKKKTLKLFSDGKSILEIGLALGISISTIRKYLFEEGVQLKEIIKKRSRDTQTNRKNLLIQLGINPPIGRITTSEEDILDRYYFFLQEYDFVVPSYTPFLKRSLEKLKIMVNFLKSLGVDWKHPDNQNLLSNSEDYILTRYGYLRKIGANEKLHFILGKKFFGLYNYFSLKNNEILDAVLELKSPNKLVAKNAYNKLINLMINFSLFYNRLSPINDTITNLKIIAKEAFFDVYSNCTSPENDPVAFLTSCILFLQKVLIKQKKNNILKYNGDSDDNLLEYTIQFQ